MKELINNIEILANQVLITLKKDKVSYKEFNIAYETYLYIIKLKEYSNELVEYEDSIRNLLINAKVSSKEELEMIYVGHIKRDLQPKEEEQKIPCLPFKK